MRLFFTTCRTMYDNGAMAALISGLMCVSFEFASTSVPSLYTEHEHVPRLHFSAY
jgi:hypothetical protein